jgi:hypothetical protein
MTDERYELVGTGYKKTADVPKDDDLFYRCTDCGVAIPSVPSDNVGCDCGNVFIDRDYWRLIVADITKLEVIRRVDGLGA